MKKILVGVILLVLLAPAFSFAQETPAPAEPMEKYESIQKIQNAVKEYTPGFITRPLFYVVNKLETFRTQLLTITETRKAVTKAKIDGTWEAEAVATTPEFLDAFKYLEIFLLIILIFAFGFKIIFYGILVFLLLLLSRFFWYRFY